MLVLPLELTQQHCQVQRHNGHLTGCPQNPDDNGRVALTAHLQQHACIPNHPSTKHVIHALPARAECA